MLQTCFLQPPFFWAMFDDDFEVVIHMVMMGVLEFEEDGASS
jgi:hypothetical protein